MSSLVIAFIYLLVVYLLFKVFLKQRLLAFIIGKCVPCSNKLTGSYKRELFASLSGIQGEVLELGIGTGANLAYYPDGIEIVGLDPNPYMSPKLEEALRKHPEVKLKKMLAGKAEDLSAVAGDNSYEAVVETMMLCSVVDTSKCLSEIKRVLKKGGRFYFLDHTVDPESFWMRCVQYLLMPLWYPLFDCSMIMKTWQEIERAGFSNVSYKKLYLTKSFVPFLRAYIIGYAEK
ncbi:N6-adenosine-methyltransferase TMT1A-like [Corticium candelabrum]|uniref:N6-adenosine-methyltransferase TMT1A-like n=1 Tax=Corticium candelabrum TaxID=121492 RepID=UPI002E265945|nr:N6-adenosine-methyltransferase TMT1A-like [Corticium candelabrum]